jgi:anaerobic ribonucleoside-triphosphate reductase activating protein
MKYGAIKKTDIANGEGVRVSIWVSGCRFHCPGCFNKESQSFDYGEPFNALVAEEIYQALRPDYISGLTILGGEPLDPYNVAQVTALARVFKFLYRDKTLWIYTGYKYEEVKDLDIMNFVDVLVDGQFQEDKKDISLQFRGSSNQRIIDVQKSRRSGSLKEWRLKYEKSRT